MPSHATLGDVCPQPVGSSSPNCAANWHPLAAHAGHLTILPPGNSSEASRPRWNFWKKRAATPSLSASNWETGHLLPTTPPCSSSATSGLSHARIDDRLCVRAALREDCLHSASHHSEAETRTGSRSLRRRTRALAEFQQREGMSRTCVRPRDGGSWQTGAAGAGHANCPPGVILHPIRDSSATPRLLLINQRQHIRRHHKSVWCRFVNDHSV